MRALLELSQLNSPQNNADTKINALLESSTASNILKAIEDVRRERNHQTPYTYLYTSLAPHLKTEWAEQSLGAAQIADTYNIPSDIAEMINQQLLLLRSGANKKRKRKTQRKKKKKRKKKKLKRPRSRSFRRKRNTATTTRH